MTWQQSLFISDDIWQWMWRWQGDRLWRQLARERSCWTLSLHPFPIKPDPQNTVKRRSLSQPSNAVFGKRERDVQSESTTPEPQEVRHLVHSLCNKGATQLNSTQPNATQASYLFLRRRNCLSSVWVGGWMRLHTVLHLMSCWSLGCRFCAQQMVWRGDLHMQSILKITGMISAEI